MKKNALKIFAMLVTASVLATGCTNLNNMVKKHDSDAEYVQTPNPMEAHGDVVKINIAGSFKPKYFHKKAGVMFQPELQYDGGSLPLKPLILKGESAKELTDGTTIANSGGTFNYTDEIPYKPEYTNAKLIVNPAVFPSKSAKDKNPTSKDEALTLGKAKPMSQKTIATGINTTPQLVDFENVKASLGKDEYKAPENNFQTSAIFFAKDLWNLNLNLPANKDDSAKKSLENQKVALASDQEFASIKITAWASPEGEESRNHNLSEDRSKTAEKYLRDMYKNAVNERVKEHNKNLPKGQKKITAKDLTKELPLTIGHEGEDWDGFLERLEASDVRDKSKILNVIRSNTDRAQREQEMRNMVVIYPELEDAILPSLRRAEMVVEQVVPAKSNEEMAELSTSNPSELTVEELLFAATLTEDNATKMQIYKSASEVYPEDWRGFNNVAMLLIADKKFDEATELLEKAQALSLDTEKGEIANNQGVIAMNKKEFDVAKKHFEEAKSKTNEEASANLALILIKEGDYAGATAGLQGENGDLNLALAQILANDLSTAKQTLDAAEKSPKSFYLRAIVAAREDNLGEIVSNLKQTNADFKKQAQTDVEFQKFANKIEFVNAVK